MTVHFIGAGPGAADLITLRGRDLIAASPVCLYAGSIIPEALLKHCPAGARIVNTAPLSLDEIEAEFVRVARLTSVNFSSMLQDIRGGRETEINYMNGYLSRMGRKYGIQTPVNDMLRTLVKMKGVMPSGDES